jgi:rhodanese-related sulfurtransferase
MMARLMGLKTVSTEELERLIQSKGAIPIDVNARQSWLSARVPGALHLDPAGYGEGDLPSDKDAMLVFYCANFLCSKAPKAARRAERMGYRNVRVLSAGISGWLDAKLATESGEPAAP